MKSKKLTKIASLVFLIGLIANVSALTIQDVDTNPSEVAPGSVVKVEIEMENNLDEDVQDVSLVLDLSDVPLAPVTTSEDYFDEIEKDDDAVGIFNLIAEADSEAGTYKIPVELEYFINDEKETKNFVISVTINSKPELVLSTDSVLLKNQKNELDIKITNIGLSKAKLLEVQLQEEGFDILSATKVYIGDLENDDFDAVSFDVFLKSASAVSFPIILHYRDSSNKEFTEQKFVTAKVYSLEEAQALGLRQKSNTRFYVSVVICLIVLWLVYRFWKKRQKRKKAEAGRS